MNKFSVNTQPQSRHEPQSYQSHDSYTSLDPQHNRYREPSPPLQYEHKLKSRVPVVLHIKLSKDLVKEVRCFSDDNPELLAADFCQENNLPPELVPVVQKMIQTQFKHASEAKGQKEIRSKSPTTNSMTSSPSKDEYMPVRDNNAMKPSQFKRTEPSSKASVRPEEYREEQSHSKLVAKLDINIGPSQSRELLLFEGEDPAEVAYFFCSQNDLPNNIIEVLVAKLRNAQELYYRKKGKAGSEAGSSMVQSNSQHRSKAQLDREEAAQPVAAIKLTNSLNQVNTSEKARPGSSVVQSHSQIRSKPQIDKEPVAQPILSPKVMSSLNQVNMSEKGKPVGSSNSVAQSQVRSKAQLDKEEGAQPFPPSLKAINSLNQVNMSEKGKPIGSSSNVAQSQSQIRSKTQLEKQEASQHVPSLPKVGNSLNQVPLSERSGRSKSPGEAVIFGQLKGPNSMHDSVHSNNKPSEKDTFLYKLEAQVGSDKTQVIKPSQLGSDDSKASDAANMYERWQNLIKERRNIQQIEPENIGIGNSNGSAVSSVGKFAVEKKTSERSKSPLGRSKTPKREVNPEEYYKLAMKSLIPSETAKAKVENIGQVERAKEEINKRKLNKKEADQLIDRLYGDALHRKANEDEYKLFELGVRPMREARDLTFKPGFWERRETSPDGKARPLEEPRSPTPKEIREQKLTVQENKVRDTFTFKPYVSDASRKLLERKNRSTSPIHDRLYTDGLASKKNKDVLFEIMLEETCPFQPNVEKYRNAPVQPEPDFFKKLTKRELKKNDKKMDQMALESQPLKDSATGQDFFKPKINKDKYYYKVKERDDAKEKEKMLILKAERREKERLANASRALMEIFEQLDDDKDGYISAKKIELSNLDAKVLEALIKVFDIIEDKKLRIDFEGFERLIEDNLSAEQKNFLKHEYEDSQEEEQETVLQQTGSNTIDRSRQSCYREVDMWSRSKGNRTQRSPLGDRNKPKIEEVERVTEKNLTRHYQRLLGKKEDSMVE